MKREPIKPRKSFTKKYNFKTGELDANYLLTGEIDLTQFRPFNRDIFIPNREPNNNGHIYNINVEEINPEGVMDFMAKVKQSLLIPPQYLGNPDSDVVGVEQMGIQRGVENLYGQSGHPIGISSRQIENTDGSVDLLSYDLVAAPSSPWSVLGGERLTYDVSTTMLLGNPSKKSFINRCINKIKNLFNRKKK